MRAFDRYRYRLILRSSGDYINELKSHYIHFSLLLFVIIVLLQFNFFLFNIQSYKNTDLNKKEIEGILESAGKKEKLAELLTLMRTQYNDKVAEIKKAGMSIGHIKALENGGLDVLENIQAEPLRTIDGVLGNAARAAKKDLPDSVIRKQGGFTGTLEEYILMKLKELE